MKQRCSTCSFECKLHSQKTAEDVMEDFSEVTHAASNFQFKGLGQRESTLGSLTHSLVDHYS